jgi:3-hydroxyisobutyrate dehydrogenase-like beta-hydroxyacid dehydrogenase
MAQVAKIVNNVLAVVNGVIIAEVLTLASAAGLATQLALDIVNAGSGASFLSQNRDAIRAMVATSDMKAISAKDLAIALEFARECGVQMPVAALATQYSDAFLR